MKGLLVSDTANYEKIHSSENLLLACLSKLISQGFRGNRARDAVLHAQAHLMEYALKDIFTVTF